MGTGPVSLGSSWFEVVGCCCKTRRNSGSLALSGRRSGSSESDSWPFTLARNSWLSHLYWTILDYDQWISTSSYLGTSWHIHPAFVVHVEVRVLLANSADPAAVDSRGRALLLMP